ncbi:hypothetical protein ACEY4Q_04155 [Escherichia coli]|uniref:hypothetical protein n=1 Tax=Escherichia coli TaxID=562 RepID=UPI003D8180C4
MFFNINDLKDKAGSVLENINISSPAVNENETDINSALAEKIFTHASVHTHKKIRLCILFRPLTGFPGK